MKPFATSERELGPRRLAIEIRGELDMAVADQVKARLRAAMAENDEIVVVLGDCEFIDSTGIATLLLARNAFAERDGRLVLCEPTEQVQRVLAISGLTDDEIVFDSLEAALSRS
ncbi:MAG TPA: STAS domain-containing protein [Solirubrobacterales bacterium]|nr:STAS domain-containing protein [Solirubrobacterales bacterium]